MVSCADGEEREKRSESKIIKILYTRATVTVYIFTVTVALVYIIQDFGSTDVVQFWDKMCKNEGFFYYKKVSTHWCGCS